MADAEHRNGELTQAEGIRFPLPLRRCGPRRRTGRTRPAGIADMAMARLRSKEDEPGISNRSSRKGEAFLPRHHLKPRRMVAVMPGPLSDLAKNTFLVVGALFPIVNPIGNTPIFLSLTRGLSSRGRTVLARMIALNGLALILASIFIGTHILAFFGISLPVVQVGGGLLVIATGWTLLRQPNDDHSGESGARQECHEAD